MRLKCPGSGQKVAVERGAQGVCPVCNCPFEVTKHSRLWTHSRYPKSQEAWEHRAYWINKTTGQRIPLPEIGES